MDDMGYAEFAAEREKRIDELFATKYNSAKEMLDAINNYEEFLFDGRELANSSRQCQECKHYIDDYMVHDKVWLSCHKSKKGFKCLQCFEKALGRPLTLEDFIPMPINKEVLFGYMIAERRK